MIESWSQELTLNIQKSVRLLLRSQCKAQKQNKASHSSTVKTLSYVGEGQRGVEGRSDKRSGAVREANHTDAANTQELFHTNGRSDPPN